MDKDKAAVDPKVGHLIFEKEELCRAVRVMEEELEKLATAIMPVLRSPAPSPGCDKPESDSRSDCPLANEIGGTRRTVQRLTETIRDLMERLEV